MLIVVADFAYYATNMAYRTPLTLSILLNQRSSWWVEMEYFVLNGTDA